MTKPQITAFLFAGVAIAFTAVGVVVKSFAWRQLNALAAANAGIQDPAVVAEFGNLRMADYFFGASVIALFLGFYVAFHIDWKKSWQLYLLVILGLSCVFFASSTLF